MATRTSIATDDFNRAGPALGSNWTATTTGAGFGTITITGSTTYTPETASTTNIQSAVWAGTGTFTADQYSVATYVSDADFGTAGYGIGVICRSSTDQDTARDNYYHHAQSNNISQFGKFVNGTKTTLNSAAQTWNNNDTVEVEIEVTTLRAMRNGVALGGSFTQTDSSLSTGKPGIAGTGDTAVSKGDNWIGGNLTATATALPPPHTIVLQATHRAASW